MNDAAPSDAPRRLTARALLVGDRIDTAGLERPDMISSLPLAFHAGANGMVALFRFGVAVMVGLGMGGAVTGAVLLRRRDQMDA